MSENVICLSDSDESVETSDKPSNKKPADRYVETDCFDFPAVEFSYRSKDSPAATIPEGKSPSNEANLNRFETNSTNLIVEPRAKQISVTSPVRRNVHRESEEQPTKTRENRNNAREFNSSEESTTIDRVIGDKSLKALRKRNAENIRPGNCLKLIQVCLDENLKNFEFHNGIVDELANFDISWKWKDLVVPDSIAWTRETEEEYSTSDGSVASRRKFMKEKHRLIIWDNERIVKRIQEGTFVSAIENFTNFEADARFTLVLYAVDEYFKASSGAKKKGSRKNCKAGNTSPAISRQDLEIALADIQINLDCSSRFVNTPQELGTLVYEFTKSIAEIPHKLEKRNKLEEKLDWYSSGDNSDTVKVDKSGIGLKRLWSQQLCQFNLASLETAEAISGVYPSPRDLVEAYKGSTSDQGETLLKDVSIRRAAGPLSTVRTIGPVLSKTLYTMFTSVAGDTLLGTDK